MAMKRFAGPRHFSRRAPPVAPTACTPTGSRTAVGSGRRSCPPSCQIGWQPTRDWPPGGHAPVVGAAQGGYAALALAAFHPDRFRYAGSMSGFLAPERTGVDGAITAGLQAVRRCRHPRHVGTAATRPVEVALVPNSHVSAIGRLTTRGCGCLAQGRRPASDPAAMIGYPEHCARHQPDLLCCSTEAREERNGHFDFPVVGDHGWSTWAPQLAAMSGDLSATIR